VLIALPKARRSRWLIADQVPGQGDGELAAFFGQQAWTMTLPQGLVRRANPIVLMAVAQRCLGAQPAELGGGRFILSFTKAKQRLGRLTLPWNNGLGNCPNNTCGVIIAIKVQKP
jgi:hypothetical protein